ncbi:hypothetical protein KCP77_03245 [Salmonella enterica subsp. enterica]|nr:hypothetical protein KCP77_03245 [Salmonella enterica subsp. enterica]
MITSLSAAAAAVSPRLTTCHMYGRKYCLRSSAKPKSWAAYMLTWARAEESDVACRADS